MKKYFYAKNGDQIGPFSLEEILTKNLDRDTRVWCEGLPDWVKYSDLPELNLNSNQIIPPPLNGYKKGNKVKLIIFSCSLLFIMLLVAGFYYYPKWKTDQEFKENTKIFNDVVTVFKRTDSIDFVKFEELAKKNFSDANFILGLNYIRTDNGLKAVESFEKALKSNFRVPALYQLRNLRRVFGDEISDKYKDTLSLEFPSWISVISEDDWLSQQFAAKIYKSTLFEKIEQSSVNSKAIEFYEKSINNGSVTSMLLLGELYSEDEDENGNNTNYTKALETFKKAADLGLPQAYSEIGEIYKDGLGVKADFSEAKKWYLKGAQNNNVLGETGMAELYMWKYELTVENIDSARYWINIAENNKKDKSEFNQSSRISTIVNKSALGLSIFEKSNIKSRGTQSNSSNTSTPKSKSPLIEGNSRNTQSSGSTQVRVSVGNLCDNGNAYKNQTIVFSAFYSDGEQVGDKWPLRSQGMNYERINSSLQYGLTSGNETFYSRIIFADCKLFLRIPYNLTVPNATLGQFIFTGKVTQVGNSYVMVEISSIQRQ
jgi:TPR repeat protein